MRLIGIYILAIFAVLIVPLIALAQEVAQAPDSSALVAAIEAGQWPMVAALVMAILVYVARLLMRDVFPATWVPWVTLVVTVLGSVSTAMMTTMQAGRTWWGGLISGIVSGFSVGLPAFMLYRKAHKEDPPPKPS